MRVGRGPSDRQDSGASNGMGARDSRSSATVMTAIREVAAEAQEVPMFSHPDTLTSLVQLRSEDLLAAASRDRRTATFVAPAVPWRALAIRAAACVAAVLSVRG